MQERQTEQAKPNRKRKRTKPFRSQNHSPELAKAKRALPTGAYARFLANQISSYV